MVYHHADKPDKFTLTFCRAKKGSRVRYSGTLSIRGYADIAVAVLKDGNASRERGLDQKRHSNLVDRQ
jgi:hypothetical protein